MEFLLIGYLFCLRFPRAQFWPHYYINDLTDIMFTEGSKLVLYAADILLYKPILSQDDFNALQTDVNLIQTWTDSNNMTFNTTKCKVMNISRERRTLFPLHPIQLGEFNLESVQEYKYLGILISSDLSWSPHVANKN